MEIRIGILENEMNDIQTITGRLNDWSAQTNCTIELAVFQNGNAFLQSDYISYQICFLDIQLDDISGLEIAKQLRASGYVQEIVFLTSFREYVFEGYNVQALNYLLKPVKYEQIVDCMNVLLHKLKSNCYSYHYHNNFFQIPYADILYFSSNNHITDIVCTGEHFEQRESLKQIASFLPPQFQQCHRTLLINMDHVLKLVQKDIWLTNGHVLPVSSTYLNSVQQAFVQRASTIYD